MYYFLYNQNAIFPLNIAKKEAARKEDSEQSSKVILNKIFLKIELRNEVDNGVSATGLNTVGYRRPVLPL